MLLYTKVKITTKKTKKKKHMFFTIALKFMGFQL